MSFKKTKVVMLSTNEKAKFNDLVIHPIGGLLVQFKFQNCTEVAQHLYFLSDEEIKEGDWGISKLNEIVQFKKNYESTLYKKIIATTDKSLSKTIKSSYVQFGDNVEETRIEFLPQPSQSFIEKFVEEYNKGNVITEVMVEYETITKRYGSCSIGEGVTMNVEQLKVSKDNTITIRKVKDSWNRDEVIELLKSRESHIDCHTYSKQFIDKQDYRELDKWIQENL